MRAIQICSGAVFVITTVSQAAAVYTFSAVSANNVNQTTAGAAALSMSVDSTAFGTVDFTFNVSGSITMSIANIYFSQDPSLLSGIDSIINGAGVNFVSGGSPTNLPSAPVGFTADYRAKADSPAPTNGVNIGETLTLRMSLAGSTTLADIIAALNSGSDLRVGMHVTGIQSVPTGGGSESFVNNVLPLPSAAGLGFAGLAAAGLRRRR